MDRTRLYYQIPYVKTFEAVVESCEPCKKGGWEVTLNSTGFYPEGGGQPSDTGALDGIPVRYVWERGGQVYHQLDESLKPGSQVQGVIDWQRRYDHMQHHTGEHILSGLIHGKYGFDNVGFHMGEQAVTIDFNGVLTWDELEELEEKANQIIYDNVPVQETFPSPQERERMEYRSKKALEGEVRIISIPDADVCACCGTHVEKTGEVGMIKVTGMIHYKGGVRITMVCGRKALLDYRRRIHQDMRISSMLSAKEDQLAQAVERMKEEKGKTEWKLGQLRKDYFQLKTQHMPQKEGPLALCQEGLDPVGLRQLCTLLFQEGKGDPVLLISEGSQEGSFSYALGSQKEDVRQLGRELNRLLEGRGGGSAQMVQGTFRKGAEEILETYLREAGSGSR